MDVTVPPTRVEVEVPPSESLLAPPKAPMPALPIQTVCGKKSGDDGKGGKSFASMTYYLSLAASMLAILWLSMLRVETTYAMRKDFILLARLNVLHREYALNRDENVARPRPHEYAPNEDENVMLVSFVLALPIITGTIFLASEIQTFKYIWRATIAIYYIGIGVGCLIEFSLLVNYIDKYLEAVDISLKAVNKSWREPKLFKLPTEHTVMFCIEACVLLILSIVLLSAGAIALRSQSHEQTASNTNQMQPMDAKQHMGTHVHSA